MGLDADGREEIERRWAALRAAKAAKREAGTPDPTLDPGEMDEILAERDDKATTRKWREHNAQREERTAMGEGNGKVTTTARPPTDCPEHPGTKLRGRGTGWCPECKAVDPGRAKPAAKVAKPKSLKPKPTRSVVDQWAERQAPAPTPRPELARAIASVEPDDDQADDLALLCDALAAIRRLSPRGRRALAVLMGE
jgi:hypothetical protein